ncbi:hypothetical protein ACFY1J_31160 [Streptomyces sp. NPDC001406]|uniref:hypothetical protein n=1 Tax=Streptomyces sp. NPDC001406 TaxID=3364572 RepID=UPI00368CBD55
MDWVKLSSSYYLDPAVASLPDAEAEIGFIRSLAYAGAQETSGFIPAAIAPSLFRRRRYAASVEALVAASLWIPVCGDRDQLEGWRIARWQEWQEELEALARRRAADRDRKRKERDRRKNEQVKPLSRDTSADSPQPESKSSPPPSEGGERARTRARPRARDAPPQGGGLPAVDWHPFQPDADSDGTSCLLCGLLADNRRHREV